MHNRDPHQALKTEVLGQGRSDNATCILAKLQWAKDDIGFSLHVSPHKYSTYGIQLTDFLSYLGFQRSLCAFSDRQECYTHWVKENFDINAFASHLDLSYRNLTDAQKALEKCGFFLDQPEGWAYFTGNRSQERIRDFQMSGDGHTAMTIKLMKQSEDDVFHFKFTWLESHYDKGWVIHYRPKHPPLSSELQGVFRYLRINNFAQCPEYDFEQCYWRSFAFESRGDSSFDSNAGAVHSWFDAHAEHFSSGIHKLLEANAEIEKSDMRFLPFQRDNNHLNADIENKTVRPKSVSGSASLSPFDVAISFAGTERIQARTLATIVKDAGYSVFYDDFYPEELWGKNLADFFDEIFRKRARYCVVFVSQEYNNRIWTNHERQSAQARALKEKGKEYILPINVDGTELNGMPSTIGYIDLNIGIEKIGDLLIKKLQS